MARQGEGDAALIERAFAKSMADARKEWLRGYDPNVFVDHSSDSLSFSDFVDKELIHFSNADNVRRPGARHRPRRRRRSPA